MLKECADAILSFVNYRRYSVIPSVYFIGLFNEAFPTTQVT
jgi:hypothetical protein